MISQIEKAIQRVIDENIPKQLQHDDFRFVMIRKKGSDRIEKNEDGEWKKVGEYKGKEPYVKSNDFKDKVEENQKPWNWRVCNYRYNDKPFVRHLIKGHAYGIIGGYGKLVIVDFDNKKWMKKTLSKIWKKFPSMLVKTGSGKFHIYYRCKDVREAEYKKKWQTVDEGMLIELRGEGNQCLGPGSIHPDGGQYKVIQNIPILELESVKQLEEFINPMMPKMTKEDELYIDFKRIGGMYTNEQEVKIAQLYQAGLSIPKIASIFSVYLPPEGKLDNCPTGHSSNGGKCFSWKERGFNCFHCHISGNPFEFALTVSGKTIDETISFLGQKMKVNFDWYEYPPETGYDEKWEDITPEILKENREAKENKNTNEEIAKNETTVYRELGKLFYEKQPYYYDRNKLWWLWKDNKWLDVDETDLFIAFDSHFTKKTEQGNVKNSLMESFKKTGRIHKPKDPPKTWIQFCDIIYDYKTKEQHQPTPDYFMVNVIPHKLPLGRKNLETPTIDKLLFDWVGDKSIVLKEFAAHTLCNIYIIQQLVALIGEGCNGKSTYINFIIRLVGSDNHGSTSFRLLKGRFESYYKMFNKLLCTISEMGSIVFKQTELIKTMTGDDSMPFEKKNSGGGNFTNYAKVVIACNRLPETNDESDGFFRRWLIVDFPNQFDEKIKNLIEDIPETEIENFCVKAMTDYLPKLLERGSYYGDKGIEDRRNKYKKRAGHLKDFIKENCIQTDEETDFILKGEFFSKFKEYLSSINQPTMNDIQIGKEAKLNNLIDKQKKIGDHRIRVYTHIKWNDEF